MLRQLNILIGLTACTGNEKLPNFEGNAYIIQQTSSLKRLHLNCWRRFAGTVPNLIRSHKLVLFNYGVQGFASHLRRDLNGAVRAEEASAGYPVLLFLFLHFSDFCVYEGLYTHIVPDSVAGWLACRPVRALFAAGVFGSAPCFCCHVYSSCISSHYLQLITENEAIHDCLISDVAISVSITGDCPVPRRPTRLISCILGACSVERV